MSTRPTSVPAALPDAGASPSPSQALVRISEPDALSTASHQVGPANPFKDDTPSGVKRKNVLTGSAQEIFVSEHAFRAKHRAVESSGRPARTPVAREGKGSATIVDGDGAYIGPWARFKRKDREDVYQDVELASDEELVEVDDDDDAPVESGTVNTAPAASIQRRTELEAQGSETTTFHGSEEFDYQGRTYMHVPQDLKVDLRKEVGEIQNFIPKNTIHVWRNKAAVTALRFFPFSGHLLLSGGADGLVKLWDVYHNRELLRSYSGHTKAVSDLSFNADGTRFLSSSYDRMIKLWDTEKGVCINRFTTGKTPHVVRFNPAPSLEHEFLAGMSDKKIIQFDTRSGDVVQEYDHHLAAVNTITFVDENRRFITTSDDKSLRAWDYGIPVPIKYVAEPDMFPMTRSALHPSAKYVAYQTSNNEILVYGAGDKFRLNRKKRFVGHHSAGLAVDLAFSPDGQYLTSGDSAGGVFIWDWKSCKLYKQLQAGDQPITCVAWHPQETSKMVTAGAQGDIRLWD